MTDQSLPVLRIIIGSTRPGRVGLPVGTWFIEQATAYGGFDVRVTDLAELNLPLMDEPVHPIQQKYTRQHTFDWSAAIAGTDAFVFVIPEYNHSFTAPVKNAIDFLVKEWGFKPVGLVTYGGFSGGLRAAQALKLVLVNLRMSVVAEAVTIPFMATMITEADAVKVFEPTDHVRHQVKPMLDELARQDPVLRQLRRS